MPKPNPKTKVKLFVFSEDTGIETCINDWLTLLQTDGQTITSVEVTATEKQFLVMITYAA